MTFFQGLIVADIEDDADPAVDNVYLTKRALDTHFNPKRNTEFDVYTFRKSQQSEDKTLDA